MNSYLCRPDSTKPLILVRFTGKYSRKHCSVAMEPATSCDPLPIFLTQGAPYYLKKSFIINFISGEALGNWKEYCSISWRITLKCIHHDLPSFLLSSVHHFLTLRRSKYDSIHSLKSLFLNFQPDSENAGMLMYHKPDYDILQSLLRR